MNRSLMLWAALAVLLVSGRLAAQNPAQDHPGQYDRADIKAGSRPYSGREGYFHALDARTGALLWKVSLGGQIVNGPITYAVDGTQYVAVISGNSLIAFALRN